MNDILFYSILFIFILEQITLILMRPAVFRFSLLLKAYDIDNYNIEIKPKKFLLKITTSELDDIINARFMFPPLTLLPTILIAQINKDRRAYKIKIGYGTLTLLAYLSFVPIFNDNHVMNYDFVLILIFVLIYYRYFSKSVKMYLQNYTSE